MPKIVVKFKKNPLQILQWSNLHVWIDGQFTGEVNWSMPVTFDVPSGMHQFIMSFPYMGNQTGVAALQLNLTDHDAYQLTYRPPLWVTSPGKIAVNRI